MADRPDEGVIRSQLLFNVHHPEWRSLDRANRHARRCLEESLRTKIRSRESDPDWSVIPRAAHRYSETPDVCSAMNVHRKPTVMHITVTRNFVSFQFQKLHFNRWPAGKRWSRIGNRVREINHPDGHGVFRKFEKSKSICGKHRSYSKATP